MGFVTFSTVNKTPGWDTLFISREEGEEGTVNVVWSRQFQDAPGPEETGTKEFYFFSPVCYVFVCVYMCKLSALNEHVMYRCLGCVSTYTACVWHLRGRRVTVKQLRTTFSREIIFRKGSKHGSFGGGADGEVGQRSHRCGGYSSHMGCVNKNNTGVFSIFYPACSSKATPEHKKMKYIK